MSSYLEGMPSLASSTSTLLDSACKHIQQCRVSQDHITKLADGDEHELMRNKTRYCVHKDELVLCIGKPWAREDKIFSNQAYPRVLSSLGKLADVSGPNNELRDGARLIKWMYHNATSLTRRDQYLTQFRDEKPASATGFLRGWQAPDAYFPADPHTDNREFRFRADLENVYDFVTVGYSNTLGWHHAHHGDTMTSVLIGGLRTVNNGDFEVMTGDIIQWYWPFERDCFRRDGRRKALLLENADPGKREEHDTAQLSRESQTRKRFYDREYGTTPGTTKCCALVKPYRMDEDNPRVYDWYRCFAVALSSARPREKVDIRICRQAI